MQEDPSCDQDTSRFMPLLYRNAWSFYATKTPPPLEADHPWTSAHKRPSSELKTRGAQSELRMFNQITIDCFDIYTSLSSIPLETLDEAVTCSFLTANQPSNHTRLRASKQ